MLVSEDILLERLHGSWFTQLTITSTPAPADKGNTIRLWLEHTKNTKCKFFRRTWHYTEGSILHWLEVVLHLYTGLWGHWGLDCKSLCTFGHQLAMEAPTPPAQPGKDDPLTTESRGRATAALDLFLLYKNVMTAGLYLILSSWWLILWQFPEGCNPIEADLEKAVSLNLFRLPEIRFAKRLYACLFAFKVTWLRNYDPQQVVLIPLDVERTLLRPSTWVE